MEHNANDSFGNGSTHDATTGTNYGSTTGANASDGSFTRDGGTDAGGMADRARSAASTAGEKLAGVGSTVRDRAGTLKGTLADALESGAERLRQQGAGGGQIAGAAATSGSAAIIADDNRLGQASNQLAGGMQGAADWLREADLDNVKSGIERQVKEHPGRSLAVAVGLGYLLGKAFRK